MPKNFQISPPDLTEASEQEQSVDTPISELEYCIELIEALTKRIEKLERGS